MYHRYIDIVPLSLHDVTKELKQEHKETFPPGDEPDSASMILSEPEEVATSHDF